MQNVQERPFTSRLEISDELTNKCVNLLIDHGYIKNVEKTPLEIDKEDAIDFWFDDQPVQFKVRCNGRNDMELCMYQPFYGVRPDHLKGRDWKGLTNATCVNHYCAFLDSDTKEIQQIIRFPSPDLLPILDDLHAQWEKAVTRRTGKTATYNYNFFTQQVVANWRNWVTNERVFKSSDGHEIWWKKNGNETFAKILAFLSPRSIPSREVLIDLR